MSVDDIYLRLLVIFGWVVSGFLLGRSLKRSVVYWFLILSASASILMSVPHYKVLTWLSVVWAAYFISITSGSRVKAGLNQKFFFIQMLGTLISVLGVAFSSIDAAATLVLLGLMLTFPGFLFTLLFHSLYISITKRAFLCSIIIPAIVGCDFLFSYREKILVTTPMFWPTIPILIGSVTVLMGSIGALIKNDIRNLYVSVNLSWLGVLLLVMTNQNRFVSLSFASISILLICGSLLNLESKKYGNKIGYISIGAMIGLPGLLGFNALFYSIKSFTDHPIFGTTLILMMCAFLSAAMIKNYRSKDGFSEKVGIKFILLLVLNFICASSVHFVGIKYGLD